MALDGCEPRARFHCSSSSHPTRILTSVAVALVEEMGVQGEGVHLDKVRPAPHATYLPHSSQRYPDALYRFLAPDSSPLRSLRPPQETSIQALLTFANQPALGLAFLAPHALSPIPKKSQSGAAAATQMAGRLELITCMLNVQVGLLHTPTARRILLHLRCTVPGGCMLYVKVMG